MKKTVLIVEDNELNMKLFNDLLEAHGYATLKTANGIEAIDLAREHHPDLILMDIQLPEVSGLEVTKWLKDAEALRDISVRAAARHISRSRARWRSSWRPYGAFSATDRRTDPRSAAVRRQPETPCRPVS